MNDDIIEAIQKNLPQQVGETLQKELEDLRALRAISEDREPTITDLQKELLAKIVAEELGSKVENTMHYRNGREAKNGDRVVLLDAKGKVEAFGVLHGAEPGNDYCNGNIAIVQSTQATACLCDCLHVDDVAALLAEKNLHDRPEGK